MVETQTYKTKKHLSILAFILNTATLAVIVFLGMKDSSEISEILKMMILELIMMSILLFNMNMNGTAIFEKKGSLFFICIGYLFSLLGIVVSFQFNIYNIWILGIMIAAIWGHPYVAISFQFILSFLFYVMHNPNIEYFMFYFILGTVLCVLAPYIPNSDMIGYVIVIAFTSNLTLWFIMTNFNFANPMAMNIVLSMLSTLGVIVAIFLLCLFGNKNVFNSKNKEESYERDMEEIINGDFELLIKLKAYSQKLYRHSMLISDLSFQAASLIGCDANLARAGALYHEIGRIKGKNYKRESSKIVAEYQFPDKVIDLIKQHNLKTSKPKSREAAIVLLSDSIISTIEYIKNDPNKKIPFSQLVDVIFELRFSKGMLDESGLTICELKKLKKFYRENNYDYIF